MKKFFLIAISAASMAACNSSSTRDPASGAPDAAGGVSAAASAYKPSEGDVIFTNDHLMVYRGNEWVPETDRVTMGNGVVVFTTGEVKKGEQTRTLADGEIVSHNGNIFDKTGNAVKEAWDTSKHWVGRTGKAVGEAAGDAGEAVGHAASKAANSVKNAVDKNKK